MKKNLVIQHLGMGWPIGAVVPVTVFPHGYAGHLSLGAVAETTAPATHAVDLPEAPAGPSEAEQQNTKLRQRIAELEGRVAGLVQEKSEADATIASLSAELTSTTELLEQATAAADDAQVEAFNAMNADSAPAAV